MSKTKYEKVLDHESDNNHSEHPLASASVFSLVTFWWMNSLFKVGRERSLEDSDVFPIHEDDRTRDLTENLQKKWNEDVMAGRKKGKQAKLWKSVLKAIPWREFSFYWCLLLFYSAGRIIQPLLLGTLIELLMSSEKDRSKAFIVASVLPLCGLMAAFSHFLTCKFEVLGIRLCAAVKGIIFLKIPLLSQSKLQEITTGQVIDLISNDVKRLEMAPKFLSIASLSIIEVPITVGLLLHLIGWQVIMSILVVLTAVPCIFMLSHVCAILRRKTADKSDRRISLMNELVTAIRAVKANAWEDNYRQRVHEMRGAETSIIRRKNIPLSVLECLTLITGPVALFLSIMTFILTGKHVSPGKTFMLLSFLNTLRTSVLMWMTCAISTLLESFVSLKRVENFLQLKNLPFLENEQDCRITDVDYELTKSDDCSSPLIFLRESSFVPREKEMYQDVKTRPLEGPRKALVVSGLTYKLTDPVEKTILENVNIEVADKSLTVITGQVGSGKSTLLASIVREIELSSGKISYSGSVAYVSQSAWVFSGTIQENILFGNAFDEGTFTRVIEACALKEDLERLPNGVLTFVGERGVVLSGGQRARVSLARAVYADADIYLLDDPLSAVDVKVGDHIFSHCVRQLLRDKVTVMASYNEKHMKIADQVIVLEEGSVLGKGVYSELKDSSILNVILDASHSAREEMKQPVYTTRRHTEHTGFTSGDDDITEHLELSKEEKVVGSLTSQLYWDYFRAALHPVVIMLVFVFFLLTQAIMVSPDAFLSRYTLMSFVDQQKKRNIVIYGSLASAAFLFPIIRAYLFLQISIRASEKLHDKMVNSVLQAPVLFFDTNPAGRILNRFSEDMGSLDELLPKVFLAAIQFLLLLSTAALIPTITNPWITIALVPVLIMFYYCIRYYLKTSRELKRLESIHRSPVFAHLSETIDGLDTIRTRRMEKHFIEKLYRVQDDHTRHLTLVVSSARWLSFRTDFLSSLFVAAVAIGSVALSGNAALIGLSLAYVVESINKCQFAIRQFSDVENFMTSVERVKAYIALESEPGYAIKTMPPTNWPRDGHVTFRNVTMRYYRGGPQVLKGLTFAIPARTKIGIVGRTGDGKTSIVAALLRMPEAEGDLQVDGVRVNSIHLQESRRCMSVLTQTPVLFSGLLRRNLDPLDMYEDCDLWNALDDVSMKLFVENLDGKLNYQLTEGGGNLSVGERQLLCLARTLLQRSKIVILDEPTAHVDPNTERTIWNTVHEKLKNSTVITIAHRLNTIMDCDLILVLRNGKVAELDTLSALLNKQDSMFYSMAHSQHLV